MKRVFSLLLCLFLVVGLFPGCDGQDDEPYIPTGDGLTWDDDYTGPATTYPQEEEVQELSLAFYPDVTMNPLQCNDFTNRALLSLIYQGLFVTDRNYNVEPMLCSSYSVSEDMKSYIFYVDPAATFSDGTPVTAEDVVATLRIAKNSGVYRSRFTNVTMFSTTDDGGISVTLNTPYENLPLLLDVPIIKATQLEETQPLGTGPYVLSTNVVGSRLIRRENWWCQAPGMTITAPVIELVAADSLKQIRDEFQFGDVGLVQADPGSDRYVDYLCDYELWDSENGIFLYIVCHRDSTVLKDAAIRKAISYAIDRETLVSEYYRGFARAASLPASPLSPYYNTGLASQYAYNVQRWQAAVQEAGLTGTTLTLAVNGNDTLRLKAAEAIAEMLEAGGVMVNISDIGDGYVYALNNADFDMYLGQTMLSPNMDLSHFFSSTGNLNYGGIADEKIYALCQQALENHGNFYSLHYTIMDEGLLCPILFRSYAVYATRGLLTDLTPSRDNVFYYSIGKTMEGALI